MNRIIYLIVFLVFYLIACNSNKTGNAINGDKLFSLLPSTDTRVDFINEVEDSKDFNILNYRNYYNGGGVALGDINNDGLVDIYFTSNLHANKLYLNKGNWNFTDVTEQAGVSGIRAWCTGVAMTDINQDGLLDIYVCNSGDISGDDRKNELFINKGNLTFSEEAEKWGLDSDAFSTHASFFDYDQDGDLDCFLLNNSFRSPDRVEFYKKTRDEIGNEGGDKLFRNDGEIFTDVTLEAGIYTSDIGFGLGVSVSDLNGDMLPDIYVSNDFWERDYLYINNGDGTFSEEIENRMAMTSLNSMGSDIADLNNDGSPEIMTTDMLPPDNYRLKTMAQFQPFRMGKMRFDSIYHQQIMQNCLQLNDGHGNFQEIAHMAEVSSSDWSWGALILDLNLDGWKDIFVSNGIQKDLTDFDFVDIITNKQVIDQIVTENDGFDFRDFLPFMPSTKIANSAFINQKNLGFKDLSKELGLATPSFSNGSSYGDLDNDGDLDLVVNNSNMECFLYKNNSVEKGEKNYLKVLLNGPKKNKLGIGAKVIISKDDRQQELQHFLSRGFESSVAPGLIFGTANVDILDSLKIIWPDGKIQVLSNVNTNQTLELNYVDADRNWKKNVTGYVPLFSQISDHDMDKASTHVENSFNDFQYERLAYRLLSTEGPKIVSGDVNGDQLDDLVLLGAADDPNKLFIQRKDGSFNFKKIDPFQSDKGLEGTCAAFIDFDQDDDLDLLVGHGGNEFQKGKNNFLMRLYENDGTGDFSISFTATPQVSGNFSCIEPCDLDKDGDMDLFIGGRAVPGHYGLVPSSYLLLNNGDGTWSNITTEEFGRLGMVTAAKWSDVDNDDDPDLLVVGDWMPITIFENMTGAMKKKGIVPKSFGWWSSIEVKDLDRDGDDDYILGNWGLNSKFKATPERPLKLYVKDFDRNGKIEQLLEWYPPFEQKGYPFATKEDLIAQLPHLGRKIEKYADYGKSTYQDLFEPEQRQGALELTSDYLQSSILWQDSSGFRLEALPKEAQVAPVFSIVAEDMDSDGICDILLFGNFYGLKPEGGWLGANKGVLLKGLPNGKFINIPSVQSGLSVKGEVRDAQIILTSEGSKRLIIARNNLPLMSFQLNGELSK